MAATPVGRPDVCLGAWSHQDVVRSRPVPGRVVTDPASSRLEPRGMDRAHVLVYATADVAPGTLAADYLGGPIGAGYHLRQFAPVATTAPAQHGLIERCVAGGSLRAACEVRRGYQLGAIADEEPLSIVMSPP